MIRPVEDMVKSRVKARFFLNIFLSEAFTQVQREKNNTQVNIIGGFERRSFALRLLIGCLEWLAGFQSEMLGQDRQRHNWLNDAFLLKRALIRSGIKLDFLSPVWASDSIHLKNVLIR